jgi:hypothetical protein
MAESYESAEEARNETPIRQRGTRWNAAGRPVRSNAPEVEARHSEAEEAELRAFYETLLPAANIEYVNYFLARTPAHWQEDMIDLIQEGLVEEAQTMVKNNVGAPPSQIVDVEAVAQAARERGLDLGSPNPVNSRFPLVNTKPTEDGPEIVGSADEATRGPGLQDQKERAYQRAKRLNEQGNTDAGYDASTSTLQPRPEQRSDTPAIPPGEPPLSGQAMIDEEARAVEAQRNQPTDSYEPPRQ